MYDMYRENILDHARNPRNSGVLDPCDIDHSESNPLCGDYLHMTLRLDDQMRITEVAFEGHGCAISQASASMLSERLVGKTLQEARQITREEILEMLGIPLTPNRMKCALLSLKVLVVGISGTIDWEKIEDEEN